jgi:chromosome segregation ATPase
MATLFKLKIPTPAPASAADALKAHRAELARVSALDAEWVRRESAERAQIVAADEAEAALVALTKRRTAALADLDVVGCAEDDPEALGAEITTAKANATELRERAELAAAKIERIRAQRAELRTQIATLGAGLRPLQHAARLAALGEAMTVLVAAESAYVDALTTAYGVAASIDELARAPGPRLDFAGELPLRDLLLPRPCHADFVAVPSPRRDEIAARVALTAESTSALW